MAPLLLSRRAYSFHVFFCAGFPLVEATPREKVYILRVPDAYDNSHPYRLVFAFAESGSSAMSVVSRNYFTLATLDSKNTIFAAPDAANGAGSWSKSDVELTDAILAQLEGDLCIDESRIFASGFSFGGAMSIALACTRADVFRGVAFFSGADLTGSCPATLTKPIAYYASQASQDSTGTPMPSSGKIKQPSSPRSTAACRSRPLRPSPLPANHTPAPTTKGAPQGIPPNTAFSMARTDGSRKIPDRRPAGTPPRPGSSSRSFELRPSKSEWPQPSMHGPRAMVGNPSQGSQAWVEETPKLAARPHAP